MFEERISTELLMIYADGKASPAERRIVMAALRQHPELLDELDMYIYTSKKHLGPAFDETMDLPSELSAKLAEQIAQAASRSEASPEHRARPGFVHLLRGLRTPTWALAAGIAILLAGASGWLLRDATRQDFVLVDDRGVVAGAALQSALETTPVGETRLLGRGLSLRPKSTFFSIEGRWYRHYDLIVGSKPQTTGLAYRGQDGIWRVHSQAPAPLLRPPGTIAGPENGDLIDAIRDKIIDGRPLTRDEDEHVRTIEHWKPRH